MATGIIYGRRRLFRLLFCEISAVPREVKAAYQSRRGTSSSTAARGQAAKDALQAPSASASTRTLEEAERLAIQRGENEGMSVREMEQRDSP
jgi:hypothetical protein